LRALPQHLINVDGIEKPALTVGFLKLSRQRLQCPFEVLVISDVDELQKGLICFVLAVKSDLHLIDV